MVYWSQELRFSQNLLLWFFRREAFVAARPVPVFRRLESAWSYRTQ